ncbi:MAG: lipid II flippase MurJ [Patescibacteria group bacterium]
MVKKLFKVFGGATDSIHEAAYLLGFFALLSQFLGLFRDRLLAHYFGAGAMLDVYYASFRIPDLIFATVASLVSASVIIPFLQEKLGEGEGKAKQFIDEMWSGFFVLIMVVSIIAFFAMPVLVTLLFSKMPLESQSSVIVLSRILLLSPIFLGLSNFLSSIVQSHKRFALYALSPVLYNVAIIAGLVVLFPIFGIEGVVVGVVLGSILHALIQIPFARSVLLFPDLVFPIVWSRLKSVAIISLPRTLTLALVNIVLIVLVSLASRMAEGSISIFTFAYNLQSVPMTIIGVSYSMAAFPTLSKLFVNGEKKEFVRHVSVALRHIIFLSLPIMALFIIVRAQIVRTIFGTGAFSWNDTRLTAACFALFSISAVAQSANLLFVRAYYASGKTKIPLIISGVSSLVTVIFSYAIYKLFFVWPYLQDIITVIFKVSDVPGTEILALPIGFTIGSLVGLGLFVIYFDRHYKDFIKGIRETFFQSAVASVLLGVAAYFVLGGSSFVLETKTLAGIFSQGLVAGLVGLIVWFVTLKLLGNKEIDEMIVSIKGKIWKVAVVAPEKEEI